MKHIPLTQEYVATVDDQDYLRLAKYRWWAQVEPRGYVYAVTRIPESGRKIVKMHRFILGLEGGKPFVDHADGDGLNNQRYNLRPCSRRQNGTNGRKPIGDYTSRFRGVFRVGDGRWFACIYLPSEDGKRRMKRVTCASESDAVSTYNRLAAEHYGDFARPHRVAA